MANKMIWSYLVHFGTRMWGDFPAGDGGKCIDDTPLNFDENTWREVSESLAKTRCNMILVDVGEFMQYETHPELAIPGSWSKQRLADELARIKGMGFEVIPKLNFSAGHDKWLGVYSRMLSTPQYYQVCKDVIAEVAEVFGNPRLFHLGMDEEVWSIQSQLPICIIRNRELYWHDFFLLAKEVEAHGARPWIWADHVWHTPEKEKNFLEHMTKDVLLSNWYYGDYTETGWFEDIYRGYEVLTENGFDQVPAASNYRCDDNMVLTVERYGNKIAPENLKGFMMAPWAMTTEESKQQLINAGKLLDDGIRAFEKIKK